MTQGAREARERSVWAKVQGETKEIVDAVTAGGSKRVGVFMHAKALGRRKVVLGVSRRETTGEPRRHGKDTMMGDLRRSGEGQREAGEEE